MWLARSLLVVHEFHSTAAMSLQVSVAFIRNVATVSSGVYLSQTDNVCSWFKETPPFFNSSFLPGWPLWSYE